MLCLRCATPLPPGSSACHRCGARAPGRTYSSALIVADTIPDTQPEIPEVRVTPLSSGVYPRPAEAARPVPATTQPVTTIRVALTPTAPASPAPGEPYTLRHLVDATFGVPTRANRLFPRTTIQRMLAERLETRLATNKWVSAALGALVAVGVGLGLSVIAQSVVNAALGTALQTEDSSATAAFTGDTFAALLGGNPIKLFLLAQHVPLQLANGASAANGRLSLGAPLTLFALIPIVALLLGGTVASASDFERRSRYSVARGALLGPIYAVALLLLSLFSLSPLDGAALNVAGVTYIMASPFGAFLSGLAWGTLFGALGGWLHLHGRRWLRALPASLERLPLPRLVGALLGGLTALGAGLLACLGVALAATVYLALNGMAPALSGNLARLPATPGELLTSLTVIVTLAPSLAATLWGFSVGAPAQTAQVGYTGHGTFQASFGAFGVSTWGGAWLLLALVPVVSCLIGGRIAARFIGARTVRGALVTGALIALPVSVGTYLLIAQAELTVAANLPGGTFILDVSPDALTACVRMFLLAAVTGAIGGWSTLVSPSLTAHSARLPIPGLLALRVRLYATLDTITRRSSFAPLSPARALLYDAALAVCGLSVLTLALDGASLLLARSVSLTYLSAATSFVAALLVATPFLWLALTLISTATNLLSPPARHGHLLNHSPGDAR
ncbi:MAG TPA: hypothetical protein VH349_04055 [Ktedonobacterales bacterium]